MEIDELGIMDDPDIEPVYYYTSIDRLRIILMFFLCAYLFGFPTAFGGLIKTFCGFVPIAFFIISGYLVLREGEDRSERIVRAIKRTAITFLILAVVYFAMNCFIYVQQGVNFLPVFASKRFWFNFIVMNVWQFDIGNAIWYVQALLYAYIIIYFLDKWKLLHFDWLIAALLIILTVCTGELAGILRWNVAGYTYLPGNFLTRALPYVLLGGFIHRKMYIFDNIWRLWYYVGILVGLILMVSEIALLGMFGVPGYYGHLIGMPVVAVSMCMLAFQDFLPEPGFEIIFGMSRWHINCIYYFCQPVSIVVVMALSMLGGEIMEKAISFTGIITFVVCFCLAWLIAFITNAFYARKYRKNSNENEN